GYVVPLTERPSKNGDEVGHDRAQDQRLGSKDLTTAERQQLGGDSRRSLGGVAHDLDIRPDGRGNITATEDEVGGAEHHRHLIVDLVGHAARELPHTLEALERSDGFLCPRLLGDIPGEASCVNELPVLAIDAPTDHDLPDRSVLAAEAGGIVVE